MRVVLDCDPGIDDTLALMYLAGVHRAGEIELVGVTTTAGNAGVEQCARNAAWVLQACGLDEVPVAMGRPGPAEVELVTTPETHGPTGMGHLDVAPKVEPGQDWRGIIWQQLSDAHLIVTGPATNLAAWGGNLGQVTMMGGAVNYRGNTTPTAEWNFWVDPHAAARHFDRPGMTTLCSLQVTEQFTLDPGRLEQVQRALGNHPLAAALPELLRFYFEFHQAQGEGYLAQIHDLLTCMIALGTVDYEAIETTVAVEADSPLLRGTSVADLRGHWGREPNAWLVTSVDIDAAHAEFLRAMRLLG